MATSKIIIVVIVAFLMPYVLHFFFDVPMGFDESKEKEKEDVNQKAQN